MTCCNNCCCRIPTLTATSFSVAGGVTTILVGPFAGALHCSGRFNLCIPFDLPQNEAGNTVSLSDGTTTYPMQDKNGNSLRVGQILYAGKCGCPFASQRKFLHVRLLCDPVHVQVLDCLPSGCAVTDSPSAPAA